MVADYLFDVKYIDICAPAFFKHNDSFIATVHTVKSREVDRSTIQFSNIFGVLLIETCYLNRGATLRYVPC